MPIKSFRGQLVDGGEDIIPLSSRTGITGYRIIKFETISNTPGIGDQEFVTKIYKIPQSTVDAEVDFTDNTLLGVCAISHSASISEPYSQVIFFDQEIFNQDIYVTGSATAGSVAMNYYIELEAIRLNETENTVATLKDIRNRT
jgi:hypothetical protein